jgi:hypothetical protein
MLTTIQTPFVLRRGLSLSKAPSRSTAALQSFETPSAFDKLSPAAPQDERT